MIELAINGWILTVQGRISVEKYVLNGVLQTKDYSFENK